MKNNDLILESIRERDIDLLLIEELNVNRDFCSFFVQNIFEDSSNIIEAKALHSVVNPQFGETDILFFSCSTASCIVSEMLSVLVYRESVRTMPAISARMIAPNTAHTTVFCFFNADGGLLLFSFGLIL